MVRVKIKKPLIQEALKVDQMGLPDVLVRLIKKDLSSRLNQVRLGLLLKDAKFQEQGSVASLFALLDFSEDGFVLPPSALKKIFSTREKRGPEYGVKAGTTPMFDYPKIAKFQDMALKHLDVVSLAMTGEEVDDRDWRPGMPTPGPRVDPSARPLTLKDLKGMRKSFIRFMNKNANEKKQLAIDTINNKFDEIVKEFYYETISNNPLGNQLITFLRDHPTNEKSLNEKSYEESLEFVRRYFNEQEKEENIVIKYKNGFFWYNIGGTTCSIEAQRMGHCGSTTAGNASGGDLYSLREKGPAQKISDSHVTIAFKKQEYPMVPFNIVYQIKGKGNCTPNEKYGPYIVDFLKKYDIEKVAETGQYSECDFTEFIEYLQSEIPEIEFLESEEEQLSTLVDNINDDNYDTEHITFHADHDHDGEAPYAMISASVSFTVELDIFSDYEDTDFLKEIFEEEEEKIAKRLYESGLEDVYSEDNIDVQLKFLGDFDIVPGHFSDGAHNAFAEINLNLSGQWQSCRADMIDSTVSEINGLSNYYDDSEIDELREKVKLFFYKSFEDIINPDGPQAFAHVVSLLPTLREEFEFFEFELDEEEGELYASVEVSMPLRIKQFSNAARYSGRVWDRAIEPYVDKISELVKNQRFANKIEYFLDKYKTEIAKQAERQMKLDFGDGFELEDEPEKRTDAPFDFEIMYLPPPRRVYVGEGFYQPKVSMEIMITAVDKKANILYSIEYLRFVESVLPRILQQLPVANAQERANEYAKETEAALKQPQGGQDQATARRIRENKKIKIKFR